MNALMTLIFKIVRGRFITLFCLWWWPENPFWHCTISRWADDARPKTDNHWPVVDTDSKVFYCHFQLSSTVAEVMIWTQLLPFSLIQYPPVGKAEPRNSSSLVSLILPKSIHLFEYSISPAIDVFMNKYPDVTAHYSPVIYLSVNISVKQHIEHGEIILTKSVLPFLCPIILFVSIALTVPNPFSDSFIDFRVGWVNPGTISMELIMRCSGNLEACTALHFSLLDSSSASQLSSLAFGLHKSLFQPSWFMVSEMLPGGLTTSHSDEWHSNLIIRQTYTTSVYPPGKFFADKDAGKFHLSDNLHAAAPSCSLAKNISVWAEWLSASVQAPSEPSETPRCWITLRPVAIPHVALQISLQMQFRYCFSLFWSQNVTEHSGVVANCDHTSEWVHWVHTSIGIAMQLVMLQKSLLVFLPPAHKIQFCIH